MTQLDHFHLILRVVDSDSFPRRPQVGHTGNPGPRDTLMHATLPGVPAALPQTLRAIHSDRRPAYSVLNLSPKQLLTLGPSNSFSPLGID